jgi:hypothetical protein
MYDPPWVAVVPVVRVQNPFREAYTPRSAWLERGALPGSTPRARNNNNYSVELGTPG